MVMLIVESPVTSYQSAVKAVNDAKVNNALDQAERLQTVINSVPCWLWLSVNNDNMA